MRVRLRVVQMPDGRAHVLTRGERCFRVLETTTKDGYLIGRVEWLDEAATTAAAGGGDECLWMHPAAARHRAALNAWGREEADAAQRVRCGMVPLTPLEIARAAQVRARLA